MRGLDAPDKRSALERAKRLWGDDVRVQSQASEAVMRDELSAARKRKLPNRYTDHRGDGPEAA